MDTCPGFTEAISDHIYVLTYSCVRILRLVNNITVFVRSSIFITFTKAFDISFLPEASHSKGRKWLAGLRSTFSFPVHTLISVKSPLTYISQVSLLPFVLQYFIQKNKPTNILTTTIISAHPKETRNFLPKHVIVAILLHRSFNILLQLWLLIFFYHLWLFESFICFNKGI